MVRSTPTQTIARTAIIIAYSTKVCPRQSVRRRDSDLTPLRGRKTNLFVLITPTHLLPWRTLAEMMRRPEASVPEHHVDTCAPLYVIATTESWEQSFLFLSCLKVIHI